MANESQLAEGDASMSLEDFLTGVPPGQEVRVTAKIVNTATGASGKDWDLTLPNIRLYCGSPDCDGEMIFISNIPYVGARPSAVQLRSHMGDQFATDAFLRYMCRHCQRTVKTFAVSIKGIATGPITIRKYGEQPTFGRPFPRSLLTMFDADKDLLLRGRICENQGLGLGAMGYYRRVIENQKSALFDGLIGAAEGIDGTGALIQDLREAKTKRSFDESVEAMHAMWPESLKINGQNPLSLLHAALSVGLHTLSEAQCTELATNFRVVLVTIADRIAKLRQDQVELNEAVKRLTDLKNPA